MLKGLICWYIYQQCVQTPFLREKAHLSLQDRGAIVGLSQHGVDAAQVAEIIGCHINTVKLYWNKRYEETLDVKRQIGSGRPPKTTPAQDRMIIDAVKAKPITTAQEIAGI